MAAGNVDSFDWPLDTSVRVALFVPTTPDGWEIVGPARSVYYCPRVHGAIGGLTFELYAILEDWVDPLRLARYFHNSYTYVMRQDASLSDVLRNSLPLDTASALEEANLSVGVTECDTLEAPPHPTEAEEQVMEVGDSVPPEDAPQRIGPRTTRLVRIHMQNHHILQYLVGRFGRSDELDLTVARGVKRKAAFALLYMHRAAFVHAEAAAAAEASVKSKIARVPKGTKHDAATMFRGTKVQAVLPWNTAKEKKQSKTNEEPAEPEKEAPPKAPEPTVWMDTRVPHEKDVLHLLQRDQDEINAKRMRDKQKKKSGGAVKPKKRTKYEPPHLRLARTSNPLAIFLQQLHHIKIDAFVHEYERELAARNATALAQARTLVFGYVDATPTPAPLGPPTPDEKRASHAKTLAFTRASTLMVHVPSYTAKYVSGQLTRGPVSLPHDVKTEDVRRIFGTRPPLLESDVFDPNCVHWLASLDQVRFARELGGTKRSCDDLILDGMEVSAPRPKKPRVDIPLVDDEIFDMSLLDLL